LNIFRPAQAGFDPSSAAGPPVKRALEPVISQRGLGMTGPTVQSLLLHSIAALQPAAAATAPKGPSADPAPPTQGTVLCRAGRFPGQPSILAAVG
jgi:hypothetical protein